MSIVKIWQQDTVIPTYKVYPPEKNPLFIEKRAYQGSTGKVYPLPVTEKISDTKEDVSYHAVYLENEYLKLMILPELGGRIQRALTKRTTTILSIIIMLSNQPWSALQAPGSPAASNLTGPSTIVPPPTRRWIIS